MIKDALVKLSQRWDYDFFVSYRRKDNTWFDWVKFSEWKQDYAPTDREILPCELVLETDESTLEENERLAGLIILQLINKKKGFYAAHSGNKSVHIHSFWSGLEKLAPSQRTKAKELIAKWIIGETYCGEDIYSKIDKANFGSKHLIRIFGAKHYATGKKKELWINSQDFPSVVEPEKINSFPN